MPVIFGREVPTKTLWIGGGLAAAAVAIIVYLRARAASNAAAEAPAPQPDQGAAGMSVAAPGGPGVADQYQQQLQNSELEAQSIANQYQRNLVTQQEKQFAFQQSQMEALAPAYQAEQRAQLAVQTHYLTAASKAAVSCPGNASLRTAPDGSLYCRQKTSGGFLGIPIGDIFRTVQGFIGGVEAAAPSIGYQAANEAAQYYTGKVFRTPSAGAQPAQRQQTYTPPLAPQTGGLPIGIAPHGYQEINV